jgi:sterol desaturase/sphingolipid hydroxylase (fatty acid hydroxylase superfamily)
VENWELMSSHLQSVLLSAALIALFTTAELVWPTRPFGTVRGRAVNIAIGIIVGVVVFFLLLLLVEIVNVISPRGLLGFVLPRWAEGPAGTAVAVLAYGVTWDFFQYWFHRAQHTLPRLWPSHRVHHSDGSVNTTTALRRSILETFLIFVVVLLPTILVVGVHVTAAMIAFAVFYGWGFFNHANIRLSLGRLTPILSGPEWHRLHHAVDVEYRDKNFAAYFPVLDIVFGTYRAPSPGASPASGIDDRTLAARPFRDCFAPQSK